MGCNAGSTGTMTIGETRIFAAMVLLAADIADGYNAQGGKL